MDLRKHLHTFKSAFWLGWKIESNWTDPWLFAMYSVVKPLSGLLIIVFMYFVGTYIGFSDPEYMTYMVLGHAFFMYVGWAIMGSTWMIHDDREHYQVIKYVYVSPSNFYVYYLGRGAATFLVSSSIGSTITIVVGALFLNARINIWAVNPLLFLASFAAGLVGLASLGMAIASLGFFTSRATWGVAEGLSGIFFLFSGVLFKPETLPALVQPISRLLPVTYWLGAFRSCLMGAEAHIVLQDLVPGSMLAVATALMATLVFRLSLNTAKRKGIIDAMMTW